MSVLMLEDSADLTELARMVLETRGHKLFAVPSAEQAFAVLATEDIHCILLDLKLKGAGGSEFFTALKADPRYAAIPVTLVSGNANAAQVAARLGVPWLSKPFSFQSLIRSVEGAAEGRSSNPQLPP